MDDSQNDVRLTDTQLGILAALCRPTSGGEPSAIPATDQEIADEVLLSLDAVKGELRILYRRFGIGDLPDDQRRARLVELAIEGGYVEGPKPRVGGGEGSPAGAPVVAGEESGPGGAAAAGPTPASVPLGSASILVAEKARQEKERKEHAKPGRPITPYVTAAILILVVIGGTLSISGIFNQGSTTPVAPTPATFRAEVADYCKLALAAAPEPTGQDRAERARGYLAVIEAMRGRLESLVPPGVPDVALERFGAGLANATNYTSDVAEAPPAAGSRAEAKDVAELTSAAGQVHSGAVGYKLGSDCLAIGDFVAASARNAAAP